MLQAGDQVPLDVKTFSLTNSETSLQAELGKYVVLYFYPADDTPGCTTEACSFRDFNAEIAKLGAKIIGISQDSVESHAKFKKKYHLNFELWADSDLKLHQAFGVWGWKKLFGREFMGTLRTTFLIDPAGVIIKVWENVKSDGHAKEVYEFLNEYKSNG